MIWGEENRSQGLTVILDNFEATSAILIRRAECLLLGLTSQPETMGGLSVK